MPSGIPYYDKTLLREAARRLGFEERVFRDADEKRPSFLRSLLQLNYGSQTSDYSANSLCDEDIYALQSRVIKQLCEEGPCVIVGPDSRLCDAGTSIGGESFSSTRPTNAAPLQSSPEETPRAQRRLWRKPGKRTANGNHTTITSPTAAAGDMPPITISASTPPAAPPAGILGHGCRHIGQKPTTLNKTVRIRF